MSKSTVTIEGQNYRVVDSTIPADTKFDRIRAAYAKRGIVDCVNALPPRNSVRHVQLHIFADGSAKLAHSLIDSEVAREANKPVLST